MEDRGETNASERTYGLIANTPDWRGAAIAQLRRIFHDADPEIVEEWKWMGSPVFSHGGIVGVITLLKNKVKLTFSEGARLADPDKLFNTGLAGNKWRAIGIHEGDKIDERVLKALIRSGVGYNLAKAKPAGKTRSAPEEGERERVLKTLVEARSEQHDETAGTRHSCCSGRRQRAQPLRPKSAGISPQASVSHLSSWFG